MEIPQILLPILALAARCLERSVLQLILVQLSINAVPITLIMTLKQLLLVIVQIIALQGHFTIVNVINWVKIKVFIFFLKAFSLTNTKLVRECA